MQSPRLALGTALAVLFSLTVSPVALGQKRPRPEDDIMRRTPPPRPTPVPVAPASHPAWVANQGNQIWRWKGTSWDLLPGSAKDIAIGPDGSVLIVSTTPATGGFQIQRWRDGQWIPERDAVGAGVAAGPAGALYVMRDTG